MSKDSIITAPRDEVMRLCRKIMGNAHCIDSNDIKILDHLSKKGFYDPQKAKLVPNNGHRVIPKIEKKYLFKPNII